MSNRLSSSFEANGEWNGYLAFDENTCGDGEHRRPDINLGATDPITANVRLAVQ